jgi:hypothetical protein
MNLQKTRIKAVVFTVVLIGALLVTPVSSLMQQTETNIEKNENQFFYRSPLTNHQGLEAYMLDRNYNIYDDPAPLNKKGSNDDAGYRTDAREELNRGHPLFPGELIDDTPGRGVTGTLQSTGDIIDSYWFVVCEGQEIIITMTPPTGFDYDISLWDQDEIMKVSSNNTGDADEEVSYIADYTGRWYFQVVYVSGEGLGQYEFTVDLIGQNDAETGQDAGDTFEDATLLTPGTYHGYLDMNDAYDWYKFYVEEGDGIHFSLKMRTISYLTDYDIHLYNPSGEWVHSENYYYDDDLYYPIDETGYWSIKIDIFPGWVDCPQPKEWDYYSYGSGPYELSYSIIEDAPAPPADIEQPDITPIAQTFIIDDDPNSNNDEFGYMAAIPASNYLKAGQRYLSPVIYQGDQSSTNYYGTEHDRGVVDDTTQYVLDDWNDYLASHGKTAEEYIVPADPIEAAADIATNNWESSELAVIAVDGSDFEDNIRKSLQRTRTLRRETEIEIVYNNDQRIQEIGGTYGFPMLLTPKWCAINVTMSTGGAEPSLNAILPHFMNMGQDWFPYMYVGDGPKNDIYYPISRAGIWTAGADKITGNWNFELTKIAGHRYRVRVPDSDSVLNVKIESDEASDLLVFLVDPAGHIRAPDIPQWNGPVNPQHQWNAVGFDPNAGGFEPWRRWDPGLNTEFSAEVLHPEKGLWTVIVVPRNAEGPDVRYKITGEVTRTNPDRADAVISAANAAVIASQENAPLLYVTKDSVPSQTTAALNALGVTEVIFVHRGEIGNAVSSSLPAIQHKLTTMQQIVNYIKAYDHSENYITITSIKHSQGDSTNPAMQSGYYAPAAMLAAYHCSPVLRIGDAVVEGGLRTLVNPAAMADRIETWRLWGGDFYHGSRSTGHLPFADEPVEQNSIKILFQMLKYFSQGEGDLPPFGLDAKRYWNEALHDGIYEFTAALGLDLEGSEGYAFVAPRKDIYLPAHSVMMGNNSYAGHIVGDSPAYTSSMIARNILYPALIFANPNRDVTTSSLINFPDGNSWTTNDGTSTPVYSTRDLKYSFSSHGRNFIGHSIWEAHLERMNLGASAYYYTGHGTGGSGVSEQYIQTPYCNYPDQIWWDSWRGYAFDNWKMPRSNGMTWYNAKPPMLYDIIHYDYVDGLFENLRSNAIFYMSCTTGDADGPMVYLDHGAVLWYGNAGSGLCPQADLQDDVTLADVLIHGDAVGPAFARTVWLHYRDFTTSDPTSMYGSSSLYPVTTVQVIYGDPNIVIYSPTWTSPVPVDA